VKIQAGKTNKKARIETALSRKPIVSGGVIHFLLSCSLFYFRFRSSVSRTKDGVVPFHTPAFLSWLSSSFGSGVISEFWFYLFHYHLITTSEAAVFFFLLMPPRSFARAKRNIAKRGAPIGIGNRLSANSLENRNGGTGRRVITKGRPKIERWDRPRKTGYSSNQQPATNGLTV
jgi:hypothetical protein